MASYTPVKSPNETSWNEDMITSTYVMASVEPSAPPLEENYEEKKNSPTQEDLEALKHENEALKRALKTLQTQLQSSSTEITKSAFEQHNEENIFKVKSATLNNAKAVNECFSSTEGTKEFIGQMKEYVETPEFLAKVDQNRAILLANADREDEVGIVDLDDINWWTVVPNDDEFTEIEPESLDGAYVFVEETDFVEAIADFVAMYLAQMSVTKNLSPKEVQQLLSTVCIDLQEKGTVRRLWDWGKFLYATYGWSMTGLSIYKDPTLVKYVLRAMWVAARWMMLMLV